MKVKNIILILFLVVNLLQAEVVKDRLYLYANASKNKVELKWFTQMYSSKYVYKIYRSANDEKPKLIHVVKPTSYESLKRAGYKDDYISMIYPKRNLKTIEDTIKYAKMVDTIDAFRLLFFVKDYAFAKNMGQYYEDNSVKENKIYQYTVEAYKNKQKIFARAVIVHTYKQPKKYDFMWVKVKNTAKGIKLNWDVSKEYNYYNVYRKKEGEKKFRKINKNILYISRDFAKGAEYLYLDEDVKEGDSLTYYIKRVDMFAKEGEPSKRVKIKFEIKNKKPKAIRDIFVTSSDKKTKLTWSKVNKALGYNVYRSTIYDGNFVKLNKKPIKENFFYDKTFKAKKNFYYYVTAVNMFGESIPSTIVLAYARDTTRPSKPTKLKATTKAGLVSLKWNSVKDKDVIGYRVYFSMDEDAKHWSLINKEVIKQNLFDHNLSKTLSRFYYYYKVSAVDESYNESFSSNIIKVKLPDVTPPKQPFIDSFHAYATKIDFTWNRIVVYDFSHYNVYKKLGKEYKKLNKKPIVNATFTDLNPNDGINEYVITAVDKSGNESLKKKSKKIELLDIKPVVIKNFEVKKIKGGVKLSFTCKDKDFAGFRVLRRAVNEPDYVLVSDFIKKKSFTDKSSLKKGTYYYMIKAYDKSGNISESEVKSIKK